MAAAAMKHMASNFAKLDKFKGVDFRRWQKKMHFLLSSMSVVYVLTTPIPEDGGDDATVEQIRKRAKWDNDDYVCRGLILNGMSDSLFDIYQNVESSKELWDSLEAKYMAEDASSKKFLVSNFTNYKMTDSRPVLEQYNELLGILGRFTQHKMNMDEAIQEELTLVELGSHLRIEESLRVQDSDKPKGNNVVGPSVVNMVEHNNSSRYNDNKGKRKHHDNTKANPNKKAKPTCWKCGKTSHIKRDCKGVNVVNKANGSGTKGSVDGSSNSLKGATVHVCKDRCWFKTYELLNDGSILHMGNKSTTLVHGRGCVDLMFSYGKIVLLFNVLHVPNIRKNLVSSSILNNSGYKQVTESNKFVLSKHGVFIGFSYLSNQIFMLNIVNDNIASAFMSTSKLNDSIIWHARLGHVHFKRIQDMSKDRLIPSFDMDTEKCKTCMLTKITKKPFQNVKRETKVLELIDSDLCDLHATPSLGNKKYFVTFIDDASREVVRLPDPKLKTLGERGIECIFVGYAGHSKAFRFFVIEPNESVSINSIIESRDDIFDENKFSSVPRPSLSIPKGTEDIGGLVVPEKVTEEVYDQHSYCFNVEDDPNTFDEAMKSHDVAFWKEAINDEIDSIMGNNTWVLVDLPPGCKPLGCKWIFKRKLKVDGTIEKFKARLVIQGFRQKSGIDYFDTYAPVARISTIRLLIAMASLHNLIIHQMDVKTAFLNGELDEEVYKNQPQGFIMPNNENKVDLTKEFLSSRFSMKDMGEANVILSIRIKHEMSTPMDTSEKLMPNNGQVVSQLEYSRVIGCLIYAMTCTRPNIAFVVGKLSMYTSNSGTQHWKAIQRVLKYLKKTMDYRLTYTGYPLVLEGYTDASWISNTKDNSSTNGWVFLLGGGAIFWAFKKQTCITGSTMESEFVALTAGKEAEWLRNLILEIPLWSKPIAPISIRCDSAATLAKAYSQMYNGKSRHLGVRHSMIHELITNGVISIEFVRSQQNLADHLTKGMARDLVIKSAEGMSLKSN
ncbi:zinc finger, CCHC-type containing protein [Tanacetum coccineum]